MYQMFKISGNLPNIQLTLKKYYEIQNYVNNSPVSKQ